MFLEQTFVLKDKFTTDTRLYHSLYFAPQDHADSSWHELDLMFERLFSANVQHWAATPQNIARFNVTKALNSADLFVIIQILTVLLLYTAVCKTPVCMDFCPNQF